MGQRLPDLLGDKGHEGMQHGQHLLPHITQHTLGIFFAARILTGQARLGQFDIPIAVGVPDKIVHIGRGYAQLVAVEVGRHIADQLIQRG